MKLNYRTYHREKESKLIGPHAKRPVIEVGLTLGGQVIPSNALIDSGADVSIFPADIGEQLGIDIRSGEKGFASSMRGAVLEETFLHRITLKVGELYYSTVTSFSYAPMRRNYGILGQQGFFDIFVVQFDLVKEEIELRERK
jgi:hypothetical protein